MFFTGFRAQGTIEYLVVMGVIVVLGLASVSFVSGFMDNQSVNVKVSKLNRSLGSISITEAVVDSEGDGLLALSVLGENNITISKITLGNKDNNFSKTIHLGSTTLFSLDGLSGCDCSNASNNVTTCELTIKYTSENGLERTVKKKILIDCVSDANSSLPVTPPIISSSVPSVPSVALFSPADGNIDYDASANFSFTLTNASSARNCYLILNGSPASVISSLTEGTNSFSGVSLTGYASDSNILWDVNCDTIDTNYSGGSVRNILWPRIYLSSTGTGSFATDENLLVNINGGTSDLNTYKFVWYKNGDINATTLITNGLVSYWPMNNDTNDYYSDNDGNNQGADLNSSGRVAKSYSFNGTTDYITVSDSSSLEPSSFTISFWIKSDSFTTQNKIGVTKVDGNNSYQVGLTSDNKPYFSLEDFHVQNVVKQNNSAQAASDTTGTDGRIPLGATAGRGDIIHAGYPSIIKDGNIFKMWYSGYGGSPATWRIYYATSVDGLTWTKYDNTSITTCDGLCDGNGKIGLGSASPKGDYSEVYNMSVIKDGSTYRMYYTGYGGSSLGYRVYSATSSDGLTWTKGNNAQPDNSDSTSTDGRLPYGSNEKGDYAGSQDPAVTKFRGNYLMSYSGNYPGNGNKYLATSSDGLTWTKYNNTLPASTSNTTGVNGQIPRGDAGSGENNATSYDAAILTDGPIVRLWYAGYKPQWPGHSSFYAYSRNSGITWTKYNNSQPSSSNASCTDARLCVGSSGSDTYMIIANSAIKDGAKYWIWYSGYNNSNYQIDLATIDTGITGTNSLGNGWHHIVAVKDGSTLYLYADNTLISSEATSVMGLSNSQALSIGDQLNGELDEIIFYNRALTAGEVSQLYYGQAFGGNTMSHTQTTTGDTWKVSYSTKNLDQSWTSDVNSPTITII